MHNTQNKTAKHTAYTLITRPSYVSVLKAQVHSIFVDNQLNLFFCDVPNTSNQSYIRATSADAGISYATAWVRIT